MKKKNLENIFPFWDNCIRKYCSKISLLRREYLLSAVDGLKNSNKILLITLKNFFNRDCLHRDQ